MPPKVSHGVPALRGRDGLEGRGVARVVEPARVVVEAWPRGGLPGLGAIKDGVVLEEVLAALDGPDLPLGRARDDALGQRLEVRRAGRRARVEDEDVLRLRRADLEDADLVVPGRRAGRRVAGD